MGKIVLFLPNDDMIGQAMQILRNQEYFIDVMKRVDTEHIVEEAKAAVEDGADVIIARGNQAMYIKQNLTVPVVDIRATGQELGLLLTKAKAVSGRERPRIAVIANKNMLPDTTHMGEIYGVELLVYVARSNIDVRLLVRKIAEQQPDVIIGGSNVIKAAEEFQIPTVYFSLTQDGLREAFRVAEMMKYAREIEKKGNAQIKALTDHSFTGILRTDKNGRVILANELMKSILQKREIAGKEIQRLFPGLEEWEIRRVLEEGGAVHSSYAVINDHAVNLIITPIVVENTVEGMILFCYPVKKLQKTSMEAQRQEKVRQFSFEDVFHESQKMQQCLHLARAYMQSGSPILILGEAGTEKRELALILYHCSELKYASSWAADCEILDEIQQEEQIFAEFLEKKRAADCEKQVLFLWNIEFLTKRNQARLCDYLNRFRQEERNETASGALKLIATGSNVKVLEETGEFSRELYYLISGLTLEIPALRYRKEDMEQALEQYFERYKKKYHRYFSMTKGAKNLILEQPWYGNFIELERFCEKMILTSDYRMIREEFVQRLLNMEEKQETDAGRTDVLPEEIMNLTEKELEEWERINRLLERYHGDRQKIADELGISKVTLWRKMKRYEMK